MKYIYIFLSFLILCSCGQYRAYQKVLKSEDPEFKYSQAVNYYENQDYARSLQLFEDLLASFKNSERAEDIYYRYIYCNYHMKDYISAAYHAKNFSSKFILSPKKEEIEFVTAMCYYLDSPRYNLDQKSTYKAISELQLFIDKYPETEKLDQINSLMLELNQKLEKKYFEIAKLYYDTGKFQAAISAIDNYLEDFPETSFLENINFIQIQSYYELGKNSVDEKKQQRIKEAIFACNNFLIAFPSGEYEEEAKIIYEKLKVIQNGL